MKLTIDAYGAEENEAIAKTGYAEFAAFSAKTFRDHGFQTNATEEFELVRYADSVVGTELERLSAGHFFRGTPIRTDYSMDEVTMLSKISQGVEDITEQMCGHRYGVFFNHLSGVGLFRIIQAISQLINKESLNIFEVGPGCGYAGLMMALMGHRYASYDITQGYYLWQNRLMSHFLGDEFTEFAGGNEFGRDPAAISRVSHLPWWQYMRLYRDCPFKADVIVSNSNLAEMHPWSLKYVVRLSKMMMAESDFGMMIFGGVGEEHMSSQGDVFLHLLEAGYEPLVKEQFFGFSPEGHKVTPEMIAVLENDIPNYDSIGMGKSFSAMDFLSFDDEKMTDEFQFYSFLSDWPKL